MVRSTAKPTQVLHNLDDIPTFASEAEEAEFWDSHELGEEILAQMRPLPPECLPMRAVDNHARRHRRSTRP